MAIKQHTPGLDSSIIHSNCKKEYFTSGNGPMTNENKPVNP